MATSTVLGAGAGAGAGAGRGAGATGAGEGAAADKHESSRMPGIRTDSLWCSLDDDERCASPSIIASSSSSFCARGDRQNASAKSYRLLLLLLQPTRERDRRGQQKLMSTLS